MKKFFKAIKDNDVEKVKLLLLDKHVDPSRYNFALKYAAIKGFTEIMEILLSDKRIDPSIENNHAIKRASEIGHTEVVKILLQDKRVSSSFDWRKINFIVKEKLLKEKRNELRKEFIYLYLCISKISPQVIFEKKQKSAIPKELIKKICYAIKYREINYKTMEFTILEEIFNYE
jgi:Ankyrin repeats (3 copies)